MGTKRRTGRPSKLTPELQQRIVDYVRKGAYIERACQLCDIDSSQYRRWMERGEKEASGEFYTFYTAVSQARAQVQQVCIDIILTDAPSNPESAKWFLERSFWTEWGRRSFSLSSKIPIAEDEEEDKAPSISATKAALLSLVEEHPEIREELAQRLEALSP
jgi:transposase